MNKITFFDGLTFNMTGIWRTSTGHAQHYPTYYGLQYIHAGYLNLSIDHGPCHYLQGPVAFISDPRHFYDYYSPKGTERQHYYACFTGERVRQYIRGGLLRYSLDKPYFPIQNQKDFLHGMQNLILSIQNEDTHEYAVACLEQLLLSLQKQKFSPKPTTGFHENALDTLAQKIMLNPQRTWDFTKEAEHMNISLKHFQLLFRNTHGIPPHQFILRQRLFKAMELLGGQETSIKSIALQCGFQNELYFSRLFKKNFHQSPSDYRNALRP